MGNENAMPHMQTRSAAKTAPLPKAKRPLRRAAFWASIVAATLAAVCIGFCVYRYHKQVEHIQAAEAARAHADSLFEKKDFGPAAKEYWAIVSDYRDIPDILRYAQTHIAMAEAEQALRDKQWSMADEQVRTASDEGAPQSWVSDFQSRFIRDRDISQTMARAEQLQEAGKYDEAMALLKDLVQRYPDLDLAGRRTELIEKPIRRQFQNLIAKGKAAYTDASNDKLDEAFDCFAKAKQLAETLQDKDLVMESADFIQKVDIRQRLVKYYAAAEKALSYGKFAEAAKFYKMCDDLSPNDVYKAKYHKSMAMAYLEEARVFKENGLALEASEVYRKVLEHDPQNPEALKFLADMKAKAETDALMAEGNRAFEEKKWAEAIATFTEVLKRLDPADTAQRDLIMGKITQASLRIQAEKGAEAVPAKKPSDQKTQEYYDHIVRGKKLLAAKDFKGARLEFQAAQMIQNTVEVSDLLRETNYQYHVSEGKKLRDAGEPQEALARFKIAAAYANGDKEKMEIQDLIKEMERLLPAPPKKDAASDQDPVIGPGK